MNTFTDPWYLLNETNSYYKMWWYIVNLQLNDGQSSTGEYKNIIIHMHTLSIKLIQQNVCQIIGQRYRLG